MSGKKNEKNRLFDDLFLQQDGSKKPLFSDLFTQKDGQRSPLFSDLFVQQEGKQNPLFTDTFSSQRKSRYGDKDTIKQVHLKKKSTYFFVGIGDSIVAGKGTVKGSYVEKYGKQLKKDTRAAVSYMNYGKNGLTSAELLTLLQKHSVQESLKKADIIFLNIGGNDIVNGVAEQGINLKFMKTIQGIRQRFYEHLTDICIIIRKLNTKAVLVVNTLYNPIRVKGFMNGLIHTYLDKWNSGLVNVAMQYEPVVIVPVHRYLTMETEEKWLSADHYHLNDYGAQVVAEEAAKRIIIT